jgi:hypothetical protein
VSAGDFRRRQVAAYRAMCAAEDAAAAPRERMTAAVEYLAAVLALAPDAALSGADPNDPRPEVCYAADFRSRVMAAALAIELAATFQSCDHSRATWCADPGCYAAYWADAERAIPLDHQHCPACQGLQRGGQPWAL